MGLLSSVTTGKQIGPQIHVIAGDNGVGKTTFAAGFPKPIILDLENGSFNNDVDRISRDKIPDLKAFRGLLEELRAGEHNYQTVVIDSADALEALIFAHVMADARVTSIGDVGYGQGYIRCREIMTEIMNELHAMKSRGITSIIVAHTQIKSITRPDFNQTFDKVIMRCNDKMASIIRSLADNYFYTAIKIVTTKEGNKTLAFSDGQRVLYTQPGAGYDAKNRLDLPAELSLSYDAFVEACERRPAADPKLLTEEIAAMATGLDEKMKKTVAEQLEKFKSNPTKLKEVKTRLMKYLSERA